ncbi:hypothetical protein GN956_G19874 [Arapaima gigas]
MHQENISSASRMSSVLSLSPQWNQIPRAPQVVLTSERSPCNGGSWASIPVPAVVPFKKALEPRIAGPPLE